MSKPPLRRTAARSSPDRRGRSGRGHAAVFGGVFSWFEPAKRSRARVCAYIRREHQRGRRLSDVLHDRFVVEHASEGELGLLLEEDPVLIDRLADDCRRSPDGTLPPAA